MTGNVVMLSVVEASFTAERVGLRSFGFAQDDSLVVCVGWRPFGFAQGDGGFYQAW